MAMTRPPQRYRINLRPTGVGICLVAGILCGAVSVYSDSRVACALWVVAALVLTLLAGLVLRPGDGGSRSYPPG